MPLIGTILLACLLAVPAAALAQIARVLDTKGANMVERAGKPPRILGQGEQLDEKDVISVARDSYAVLEFRDQTRITLRPNTVFRLDTYRDKESESMLFGLVKGGFRAVTGLVGKTNPGAVNFTTSTATIGIRGTEFDARLCEDDCAAEERRSTRPTLPVAARLVDLKGSVVAVNVEGVSRKLVPGSYLRQFDEVRTAKSSYAVLLLRDGGRLVVHPDTRIVFQRFKYEPTRPADAEVELMLLTGRIGTQTGQIGKARPVGYRIFTRFGRLETRGTETEVSCTGGCAGAAADWRAQPISGAVLDALRAYMDKAGMPGGPMDSALRAALTTGGSSYADLQSGLLAAAGQSYLLASTVDFLNSWLQLIPAASGPEAMIAGLDALAAQSLALGLEPTGAPALATTVPAQENSESMSSEAPALAATDTAPASTTSAASSAPESDWRAQPIAAGVTDALRAYMDKAGLPGPLESALRDFLKSGGGTYAELQDALLMAAQLLYGRFTDEYMAFFGSWLQLIPGASSPEAMIAGLDALAAQSLALGLEPAGAPPLASTVPAQENSESTPTEAPVAAETATATTASVASSASAPDWRAQPISVAVREALRAYLELNTLPGPLGSALKAFLDSGAGSYMDLQTTLLTGAQNIEMMLATTAPLVEAWLKLVPGASGEETMLAGIDSIVALGRVQYGMEVAVTEGSVDVTTSAGTQTVNAGQGATISAANSMPSLTPSRLRPPASNVLKVRVDPGAVFGDQPPAQAPAGLYVWVREGAVQLARGGEAVDVPAGGAAVATADRVVLLDVVPNFMRFDSTPRPLPAGGVRVADAFVAADGSQSSMCIVR